MTELKKLNAGDDKLDAVYDGGALEVSSDNNPQIDVVTEEYKGTIRGLHPRHLQLITISGAIGTGLFIGTGGALKRAGPLGLLLGYLIYGLLILSTYNAMGEMVSFLPIDGTFIRFAYRFVDPSYGFAMGWVATYNNAVTVAAEATAVAGLVAYWNDSISPAVWVTLFLLSALAINLLGIRWLGEGEFWFAIFKVLLVFMLFFFTFIVMLGANPQSDRFGFRNWKEGAFAEHISTGSLGRFLGFWSVFIQASFAYGVPDYPCMCAGEAMYPRRVLPAVFGRIVYRLMFFYVGGVLCVGILVPHTDALLGTAQKGAGASPFVLAAVRLGIPVFPSVINAFILTSAWSCGTALSFTASRQLYSNALNGQAPAIFKTTWKGIPYWSVLFCWSVGLLGYMVLNDGASEAFSWITNILGGLYILSNLLQHITYLRFRKGLDAQGIDRSSLPFWKRGQRYISMVSIFFYSVIFLTNGFAVFTAGRWSTRDFLLAYLVLPIFIALYVGHKLYVGLYLRGGWGFVHPVDMDFRTGRAEVDDGEQFYPPPATDRKGRFLLWLWG